MSDWDCGRISAFYGSKFSLEKIPFFHAEWCVICALSVDLISDPRVLLRPRWAAKGFTLVMTSSRLWLLFLVLGLAISAACSPLPFSGERPSPSESEDGQRIRQQQLYRNLSLQDIPTTVAEDVILTNCSTMRYGYHMGRPVDRLFRNPVGRLLKPVAGELMRQMPFIQHWGVLISTEPPNTDNDELPPAGEKVPSPETGLIYELRNSVNTGLVYLDLKNWTTYGWRYPTMTYLGTLNKTDEELMMIGRAYIQHVGKEGFHNFYRNCQHFATWYSKALWPEVSLAQRADQLFGKALWWFRDMKTTAKWGLRKIGGWLGFPVENMEEVDSAAQFVKLEDVLSQNDSSETSVEVDELEHMEID